MNSTVFNLLLMLVMMQVTRRLDSENPTVLFYLRTLYITCQLIVLTIYMYTKSIINKKNDNEVIKYSEPPSPFSGKSETKFINTTIKEYDLKQVDQQIKSIFRSMLMMAFMHLYMKYTNPLLMQSVSAIKSALECNIVKIHLFDKPPKDNLKRPFKKPSDIFLSLMGGGKKTESISEIESNDEIESKNKIIDDAKITVEEKKKND